MQFKPEASGADATQISYAGNQLPSSNNYAYDANGNMTKDMIRSIRSISYNVLNLPQQIEVQTSLRGHDPFIIEPTSYLYTASGVKLQSIMGLAAVLPGHPDTRDRTDYVGNLIYDRTSLKKVLIDGGYVDMSGNSPEYRFFITDHLGNNRVVTDTTGTILQTNHYDPYGESLPIGAAVDSGNPYKYGDKALAYDFGARHYTSSIPRWTTMDPLCEKYYSISPYAYCAGNPMNIMDPEGKRPSYSFEFSVQGYLKNQIAKPNKTREQLSIKVLGMEFHPSPLVQNIDFNREKYLAKRLKKERADNK